MVQKAGCSLTTKCQNNHPTAIFQPEKCQGSRAGNASSVGSQQSRCPSQTSLQSLMHCVSWRAAVIPTTRASQTALRSLLPALPPYSQGKHHQISQVPPQAGKDSLSQKQLWSAGNGERSRSLFPPLSSPWQGSIQ